MSALDFLHGIDIYEFLDAPRPIRTQKSSVIGIVGTAGSGPVNQPVLIIGNRTEAVRIFGKNRNDGFTIPAALDAVFDQIGAVVVVVNVVDRDTFTADVEGESVTLATNKGTLAFGHLTDAIIAIDDDSVKASKVLTLTALPAVNDTVTIGAKTYRAVDVLSQENDVIRSITPINFLDNLVSAVLGQAGSGSVYHASTTANLTAGFTRSSATTGTAYALIPGTAGNAIAINKAGANWSWAGGATTLSGGAVGDGITAPYIVTTAGQVTLPAGTTLVEIRNAAGNVIAANTTTLGQRVTVKYLAALAEDTDFTIDRVEGVINRVLEGGKLLPNSTFKVTYTRVSAADVTEAEIIGETTAGARTGINALLDAPTRVKVQPRIIAVPGWTHQKPDAVTRNPVIVELETVVARLRAIAVCDCDGTFEEAVTHRSDFSNPRLYFHYPFDKVLIPGTSATYVDVPASARVAGLIAQVDNDEGFWVSPSNHMRLGLVGLKADIDFQYGDANTLSNLLNQANIATTIHVDGYRLWGNRSSDGTFLLARRTADLIEDAILAAHLWAVDKNITAGYMEMVVEGVNRYLRMLKTQAAILGGRAWSDPEANTVEVIANGQLFIDFEFTTNKPAEHLTFRAHINDNYVSEIFART